VSYSGCGVIFLGRRTSFGLALASFHGFTPLSARVDLMVGHFCPCWHGHYLPPILDRFADDGKVVAYAYYESEHGRQSSGQPAQARRNIPTGSNNVRFWG